MTITSWYFETHTLYWDKGFFLNDFLFFRNRPGILGCWNCPFVAFDSAFLVIIEDSPHCSPFITSLNIAWKKVSNEVFIARSIYLIVFRFIDLPSGFICVPPIRHCFIKGGLNQMRRTPLDCICPLTNLELNKNFNFKITNEIYIL